MKDVGEVTQKESDKIVMEGVNLSKLRLELIMAVNPSGEGRYNVANLTYQGETAVEPLVLNRTSPGDGMKELYCNHRGC